MVFTDTDRLDWLLKHTCAEFDEDAGGWWVVFWMGSDSPSGRPGNHIARAKSQRGCINAVLEGNYRRID